MATEPGAGSGDLDLAALVQLPRCSMCSTELWALTDAMCISLDLGRAGSPTFYQAHLRTGAGMRKPDLLAGTEQCEGLHVDKDPDSRRKGLCLALLSCVVFWDLHIDQCPVLEMFTGDIVDRS